ncbi:hypothetical protein Hypma_005480 [Hypsizygus marmoreus]|uniref:Uncharacterized protein n=1 Tax=Hypsizygus marmoreus TaxID=39966 RepID=A0A369IZ46_HYPMA|nr:hypothetical protein Hypma_005480 [Hypsizygus marmoreus]
MNSQSDGILTAPAEGNRSWLQGILTPYAGDTAYEMISTVSRSQLRALGSIIAHTLTQTPAPFLKRPALGARLSSGTIVGETGPHVTSGIHPGTISRAYLRRQEDHDM